MNSENQVQRGRKRYDKYFKRWVAAGRILCLVGTLILEAQACLASDSVFTWDSNTKAITLASTETEANFTFNFTNISSGSVTITNVHPSCGCTTAQLPPLPWIIPSGTNGQIGITVNVAGKSGTFPKTVMVGTDKGSEMLTTKITILLPALPVISTETRADNVRIATADRQAVLKGDCAVCHVNPGLHTMTRDLYKADCAICHESERRAAMVPDLHAIKEPTDIEFWRQWITHGKPGTLMPAFVTTEGGPLTDAQISILARYMTVAFRPKVPVKKPAVH
jgi:mono/diheme cytochrome c family protein